VKLTGVRTSLTVPGRNRHFLKAPGIGDRDHTSNGAYTAIVQDFKGESGVALVEVYNLR
jgi:hypothetical protein